MLLRVFISLIDTWMSVLKVNGWLRAEVNQKEAAQQVRLMCDRTLQEHTIRLNCCWWLCLPSSQPLIKLMQVWLRARQ
jgi:hypothetical protein